MLKNIEQTKLSMEQTLDCFCNGIESAQSHRPKEAIPDSCDKCEPGLSMSISILGQLRVDLPCSQWWLHG